MSIAAGEVIRVTPDTDYQGPICAICGEPIEEVDYSGQKLSEGHEINLTIIAMAGQASLPHILEVHGDCLPDLKEKLVKKNEGWKWM